MFISFSAENKKAPSCSPVTNGTAERRFLFNIDLFEGLLTVRIPLPPQERALASLEKLEFFLASKSPEKGDATGFFASGIFSVMNRWRRVRDSNPCELAALTVFKTAPL